MKTILVLPDRLDNATLPVLAELLTYSCEGDVALDCSQVDFVGGRGLEMLISATRTLPSSGCRLTLRGPAEAFCEQMGFLGMPADVLLAGARA